MRIALIADSHLSTRSPECVDNWHAARQTHPDELSFATLEPDRDTMHFDLWCPDGMVRRRGSPDRTRPRREQRLT